VSLLSPVIDSKMCGVYHTAFLKAIFMSKVVVTVTGPSASGKSELLTELCAVHNFERLVSITTRPPREGEQEGVEYYYVSEEEFFKQKALGNLLQEVCFNGKYYATTVAEAERVFSKGKVPIVIVEPGGVDQFTKVGERLGFTVYSVFVNAEYRVLKQRFLGRLRGAEPTSYDTARLEAIEKEASTWLSLHEWDSVLINNGNEKVEIEWLARDLANEIYLSIEGNNG
jgi:guanylate kinase